VVRPCSVYGIGKSIGHYFSPTLMISAAMPILATASTGPNRCAGSAVVPEQCDRRSVPLPAGYHAEFSLIAAPLMFVVPLGVASDTLPPSSRERLWRVAAARRAPAWPRLHSAERRPSVCPRCRETEDLLLRDLLPFG
jgi:hypothetical protein